MITIIASLCLSLPFSPPVRSSFVVIFAPVLAIAYISLTIICFACCIAKKKKPFLFIMCSS